MNISTQGIGRSRKSFCLSVLISLILSLSACATGDSKTGTGAGIGAVLGGILGGTTGDKSGKRIALGVLVGGAIGAAIGHHMDEKDRQRVAESLEKSEAGETTVWTNEKTGKSYQFTPGEEYESASGNQCRKFEQEVIVNGERETIDGTACKEPDSEQWTLS